MVFKKREENGGQLDPSINANGRPLKTAKGRTKRAVLEGELLSLLRKFKPLVADAINTAAKIMRNEEASHMNQLKASVILLDNYKQLLGDMYDVEEGDGEDTKEIQPDNRPVFSLRMINNEETKQDKE